VYIQPRLEMCQSQVMVKSSLTSERSGQATLLSRPMARRCSSRRRRGDYGHVSAHQSLITDCLSGPAPLLCTNNFTLWRAWRTSQSCLQCLTKDMGLGAGLIEKFALSPAGETVKVR
jgi:hypothetical protein